MSKNKTTEKEWLETILDSFITWDGDNIAPIEYYFFLMNDFNQEENKELWDAIRTALANNKEFIHPEALAYINNEERVNEGFWWWDCKNWK